MTEKQSKHAELSQQLAELNWDLEPQRDLWPDISNEIESSIVSKLPRKKSPPYWMSMAIAASLILAVGTYMFSSVVDQQHLAAQRYDAAMALYQQSQLDLIEQQHQMVRMQFTNFLSHPNTQLNPEFVAEAQALMKNIDSAAAEIKNAISVQPNNPEYTSMLVTTYQRELRLLNRVKPEQGLTI